MEQSIKQYFPSKRQQIIQTHASLILLVVQTTHNNDYLPQLNHILNSTEKNGWINLVNRIKKILAGKRDFTLLQGLDEEDHAIISGILDGIQNPATLPTATDNSNPSTAGSGIAHLIQLASSGNVQALSVLGNMTKKMSNVEGDMKNLGAIIKLLLDGERNPDILCRNMAARGKDLVLSILEELATFRLH